jgi:hypothetical protein
MNEVTFSVLQILGRLAVVVLCWHAVTMVCSCNENCTKFRHSLRTVLGWVSGAVACAGLFYPVVGGAVALFLVAAIWFAELDYETKSKAQAFRFPEVSETTSDVGSGVSR